ncbi:MAG TPA: hypothetical protein VKR32_18290, partial [Puia sp.]|nr:hypothetical protein [Puia sp.]
MNHTGDLHIEEEVKSFFDITHNRHSGEELSHMLSETLRDKESVLRRQQLLKGFVTNDNVLKDYSHYRFDLSEIVDFLETIFIGSITQARLRRQLRFSQKNREQKRGKLILMVRLFYAIKNSYLKKLDLAVFPRSYAAELGALKKFLDDFDL